MKAFVAFEDDLITSVIPFIENIYFVPKDRENGGILGFSMGGEQVLNFKLRACSGAPNMLKPKLEVLKPGTVKQQLNIL